MAVRFITIEYQVDSSDLRTSEEAIKRIARELGVTEDQVRDINRSLGEQTGIINKLAKQEQELLKARNASNDPDAIRRLNREIANTRGEMNRLTQTTEQGGNKMIQTMKKLGGIIAGAFAVSKITGFIKNAVGLAATMEQNTIAFTSFTGSAQNANKILGEIEAFAASTPFQFPDLVNTSKNLLAFGIEQKKIIPILKTLGDISAGTGKNIEELGLIYGKITTKGKAQTEELNQLAEAGIPIIQVLADQYGKTAAEIFKMAENSELTSDVVSEAFQTMTTEGGIFFDLTAKQSQSTAGRISTLKDNAEKLARSFGETLLPAINTIVGGLTDLVQGINPFRSANDALVDSIFDGSRAMAAQRLELNSLVDILKDTTLEEGTRLAVMAKIRDINPKVTAGLDAQNIEYERLDANLSEVNKEMADNIALLRKQETVTFINAKAAEARNKQIEAELFLGGLIRDNFKDQELLAKPLAEQIRIVTERYGELNGGLESITEQSTFFLKAAEQRNKALDTQKQLAEASAIAERNLAVGLGEVSEEEEKVSAGTENRVKTLKELKAELSKLKGEFTGDEDQAAVIKALEAKIKQLEAQIKAVKKAAKEIEGIGPGDGASFEFSISSDDTLNDAIQDEALLSLLDPETPNDIDLGITEIDTGPVDEFWEKIRQQRDEGEGNFWENIVENPEEFLENALGVANQVLGIIGDLQQASTQRNLNRLEQEEAAALELAGDSADKRLAIQANFDARREAIEKEAAKKRKQIAIVEAIINTALAVTKVLANPILAALVLAQGIAQIAIISSQEFKEGGYTGNAGTSQVAGQVHGQEFVLDAATTKQMGLRGKDMGYFKRELMPLMLRPEVLERANLQMMAGGGSFDMKGMADLVTKGVSRAIKGLPLQVTNMNEEGFTNYMGSVATYKTLIKSNKY